MTILLVSKKNMKPEDLLLKNEPGAPEAWPEAPEEWTEEQKKAIQSSAEKIASFVREGKLALCKDPIDSVDYIDLETTLATPETDPEQKKIIQSLLADFNSGEPQESLMFFEAEKQARELLEKK